MYPMPIKANRKKEKGIRLFTIHLYRRPPGSLLVSPETKDSITKLIDPVSIRREKVIVKIIVPIIFITACFLYPSLSKITSTLTWPSSIRVKRIPKRIITESKCHSISCNPTEPQLKRYLAIESKKTLTTIRTVAKAVRYPNNFDNLSKRDSIFISMLEF